MFPSFGGVEYHTPSLENSKAANKVPTFSARCAVYLLHDILYRPSLSHSPQPFFPFSNSC